MHYKLVLAGLSAFTCLQHVATAWQQEVHNQIGFMADEMISHRTARMAKAILEPEYRGSLGLAGGWADTVRRGQYAYSYTWHFISAKDNPPNNCGLYYNRDCQATGCVVQQIANQTQILEQCLVDLRDRSNVGRAPIDCSNALKWIVHFIGDVAQPLHTSERAFGGNIVKVNVSGVETNLHQAWDKVMLYTMVPLPDGASNSSLDPFFYDLIYRIADDSFRSPRSTWIGCDLDARRGTYCAERWAQDSNSIVCDYAYGKLVEGSDLVTGKDQYAMGAVPIIEEQIAKSAYRLAGWLDALVDRVLYGEEELTEKSELSFRVQRGKGIKEGKTGSWSEKSLSWEL